MLRSIELRYLDSVGTDQALRQSGQQTAGKRGIELAARTEAIAGGGIVYAAIKNRSEESIVLKHVSFELATGFASDAPARFFKHGYQSWSNSYPSIVGRTSNGGKRPRLVRISHQSEADRPDNAPETATSELFTIIESDGSPERLLAGFIGAGSQFSTLTVMTPSRVTARTLFDGVSLKPGETRQTERLMYWRSGEEAARMAARWAESLGKRMQARVKAPYQRGWCSWYHYFDAISENELRSNLRTLKKIRRELPIDVVQLDDGYQASLGDWDCTNAKFPSGLRAIADEIRGAGFIAGLWTAPFLAVRDSNVMRAHPRWFIRDHEGNPLPVVHNPVWTAGEDKFAYALDPTHPEVAQHLEHLFGTIVEQFGYRYLKLDFLFAAAADGVRCDVNFTRAEALRRGLDTIRHAAGEEAFILGCGCPLGPAVGLVDGMRIGPDVAPYWGGEVEPGTRLALNAIIARSFMHRRLWLNDPDCLMLRASQTSLSAEERFALASVIALSGGMLLVSDDVNLLDDESRKLFRMVMEIGQETDNVSYEQPPLATELIRDDTLKGLRVGTRRGTLHLLLNTADVPRTISLTTMLPPGAHKLRNHRGETDAPGQIELPPHSCRIIRA